MQLILFLIHLSLVYGFTSETRLRCPTPPSSSNNSIIALILARGGSRGIPLKNLAKIDDRQTLLSRALHTVLSTDGFHSTWVSTEDDRISSAVENEFPSELVKVHHRPMEVALDYTSSIESVRQFLDQHPWVWNVALIQCTSPFLRSRYLREALQRFQSADVDCVFSVTRSYKLRWTILDDGKLKPLNFDPENRPRRQDWSGEFVETGMFYFAKTKLLLKGRFQSENCQVVVIDDKDSLEIDSYHDLELARLLVNYEM